LKHKYKFKNYPITWYQFCDLTYDEDETIKWYDIQQVDLYFNNVHEIPNDKPLPYKSKYVVQNYFEGRLSSNRISATPEESEAYEIFLKKINQDRENQIKKAEAERNVEPYVYVPPKPLDVGPFKIYDKSGNLYFFKFMTHRTWSTWHEIQKGTNENGTIKEKPSDTGWKKIEPKV